MEKEMCLLNKKVKVLKSEKQMLKQKVTDMKDRSRQCKLRFVGFWKKPKVKM